MLLNKLKSAAAVFLGVCVLGIGLGASLLAWQTQAAAKQEPMEQTRGEVAKAPSTPAKQPIEGEQAILQRRLGELDGRIQTLTAQIQSLTKEIQSLRKELKPAAAKSEGKREISVFPLRNLKADEVAMDLAGIFGDATVNGVGTP